MPAQSKTHDEWGRACIDEALADTRPGVPTIRSYETHALIYS